MEKAERELKAMPRLADAMIAGRLFGSAVLLVYPTDGDVSEPIKPEDVKEGGIANLIAVDRYSLSPFRRITRSQSSRSTANHISTVGERVITACPTRRNPRHAARRRAAR